MDLITALASGFLHNNGPSTTTTNTHSIAATSENATSTSTKLPIFAQTFVDCFPVFFAYFTGWPGPDQVPLLSAQSAHLLPAGVRHPTGEFKVPCTPWLFRKRKKNVA